MGGHHLILGKLTDFISGEILDDTLDERHRQQIARLLVAQKGYLKSDITPRRRLEIQVGQQCAQLWISFAVTLKQRIAMIIHYGPGSLVTRHRPTLAMARLVEAYQIPLAVVTNGEQADILDGSTGKVVAAGLDLIPDRQQLMAICEKHSWETIEPQRQEMEARILMAFEIDDRCPCDDSVCSIGQGDHVHYMQMALDLARTALARDEFPVGCVMIYKGKIIARGTRRGTRKKIPSELDHAEILALRELETLTEAIDRRQITIYATLEPCLMCYGALLISGIGTIVYAYEDAMGGATACDRSGLPDLYKNNGIGIIPGVCRQESLALFKAYFARPGMDYWRGSLLARYTLDQR